VINQGHIFTVNINWYFFSRT